MVEKMSGFPAARIENRILLIRGQKVLIDRDLAELYGVETKQLKRAVRRNIHRFPQDFMFELTQEEFKNLRSQFGTSSWGGTRYRPMAFSKKIIRILQQKYDRHRGRVFGKKFL